MTRITLDLADNAPVSHRFAIVVLALGVLWFGVPAAVAQEDGRYLTNEYQNDPLDWNDSWRDATLGPRNNITDIDGHVGTGVKINIDTNEHFGAAMRWRFADNALQEPEHLWFRYYLRFPETFVNVGKGKLPGPAGLYSQSARGNIPSTPASPGWSARMLFTPTYDERDATHTRIGYYVYHLDQAENHGDLLPWADPVATLEHGRWYCVEGFVGVNTPGESDGLLRGWVNGEEAFSRDDLRFRRADETGVKVDSFWFDVYFGGREPASTSLSIDFDSLSFGAERLGCDDSLERGFSGEFFDDEGSIHEGDIELLRAAGITDGCNVNGDAYCPGDSLTRGQLAKLLVRALQLPASQVDYFSDDEGSVYESAINAIADVGITSGCASDAFCPGELVSRAELAAFLSRALNLPQSSRDHFADDDESPFQGHVNALAEAGITYGCDTELFCPDVEVSRAQAASFLVRAMDNVARRLEAEAAAWAALLVRHFLTAPRAI